MKHSTYEQILQDPYLSGLGIQPRLSPWPKQHRDLPWKEPRVPPVECIPPQSSAQSRAQALVHHDRFQHKDITCFTPLTCLENPRTHPDSSITRSCQGPQDIRRRSPPHQVSSRLAQQRHWQSRQMVSLQGCTHHNLYQLWALQLTKYDTHVCVICISEMSNS